MLKIFPRLVLLAILFTCLTQTDLFGQYKKIYAVDTGIVREPNLFSATKVLETNLPGRSISISGTLNIMDTSNFSHQSIYHMMTDLHGNPSDFHLFEDSSAFLFQGPRGYSACYDGNGSFYFAIGTNNRQVIFKTDSDGNLDWSYAANHHEHFSILCEDNGAVFLGQDESIQGAHDFSLGRIDSNGVAPMGLMYGTEDFEQPNMVIRSGDHYLMAGSSFKLAGYYLMIVKTDLDFQPIWGRVAKAPTKDLNCHAVATAKDGSGFLFTGRARGGADSLFVMKTDTAGNTLWLKLYNIGSGTEVYNSGLTVVPSTGDYIISGSYRGVQYLRPYLMCIDPAGNIKWLRDYGEPGINTDETLNDVIYNSLDDYLYAVGDYVKVDSNNQVTYRIISVKVDPSDGLTTCDSALTSTSTDLSLEFDLPVVTEPFMANTTYPFGATLDLTSSVQTRCSVIVKVEEPVENVMDFNILNPSNGILHFAAEVPEDGGQLKVYDLSGMMVFEKQYKAGFQKESIPLQYLSSGIYLVTFSGEEWRSPAKRWVILK